MTERERVIANLLYMKKDCLKGSDTDQTIDRAVKLLKAQEPRVMKKEEITKSEVVWLECNNICDDKLVAALPWLPIDIRDDTWGFQTNTNVETMFLDEYEKTWRCWTSRPTDEQREKVKWDAVG